MCRMRLLPTLDANPEHDACAASHADLHAHDSKLRASSDSSDADADADAEDADAEAPSFMSINGTLDGSKLRALM